MIVKRYYIFSVFILMPLFLFGCGYTTGSLLPSHLKTIYVEDFKNKIDITNEPSDEGGFRIYRAGVETDITKEIIDQFIFDGHLRIVGKDDADLILSGELIDYYKQPLRYDKFDNVEEYRIIVTVNMVLRDTVEDRIMWKEDNFIGWDEYRLSGAFASSEDDARKAAIKDLADKIVEKVIEGW